MTSTPPARATRSANRSSRVIDRPPLCPAGPDALRPSTRGDPFTGRHSVSPRGILRSGCARPQGGPAVHQARDEEVMAEAPGGAAYSVPRGATLRWPRTTDGTYRWRGEDVPG